MLYLLLGGLDKYMILVLWWKIKYHIYMATFSEIKEFRLTVCDPIIANDILSVATVSALPAIPVHQAVYYVVDTASYVYTDKTSGAVSSDYNPADLYLTDARITSWVDTYGVTGSIKYGLKAIMQKIVAQMLLVKDTSGAESTEYQTLKNIHDVYESMINDSDTKKISRWGGSVTPEIGGGNL